MYQVGLSTSSKMGITVVNKLSNNIKWWMFLINESSRWERQLIIWQTSPPVSFVAIITNRNVPEMFEWRPDELLPNVEVGKFVNVGKQFVGSSFEHFWIISIGSYLYELTGGDISQMMSCLDGRKKTSSSNSRYVNVTLTSTVKKCHSESTSTAMKCHSESTCRDFPPVNYILVVRRLYPM